MGQVATPSQVLGNLRLVTFAPPLRLATSRVGQVWHQRLEADAGHQWLRALIKAAA